MDLNGNTQATPMSTISHANNIFEMLSYSYYRIIAPGISFIPVKTTKPTI